MLDVGAEAVLTQEPAPAEWEAIPARAVAPSERDGFFSRQGPTASSPDERRRLHRFYLRQTAVLRVGGAVYAGFTRDISRAGLGLVSPVQLFPMDVVRVWLPDGKVLDVRVTRCVRLGERCYACGGVFVAGARTPC